MNEQAYFAGCVFIGVLIGIAWILSDCTEQLKRIADVLKELHDDDDAMLQKLEWWEEYNSPPEPPQNDYVKKGG